MSEKFDRQRLIRQKIEKTEERAEEHLSIIRESIRDYLIDVKGYSKEDIEEDAVFDVSVAETRERLSVDYIIKLNGARFLVLKCSPGALASRDRHLVAFARVADTHQIPYAMVTDGSHARLLDTITGRLLAEGLDSIPDKSRAEAMLQTMKFTAYPEERIEREKMILLAFEAIKCTRESCE